VLLRKQRQMAGIQAAKAKGVRFGRTKRLTPAQVQELSQLRAVGVPMADLRQRFHLGRTAIYRYLAMPQEPQAEAAD
jgi:DNA invertase Pin-like site-specific DNA recombinase